MGAAATVMSLVMLIVVTAVLLGSAMLVAWTLTVAGTGRNCGAVNRPAVEIVPTVLLPPGTPATLQLTAVLLVSVTVAVSAVELPSRTEALVGATLMETAEGGGEATGPATPPQPAANDKPKDTM